MSYTIHEFGYEYVNDGENIINIRLSYSFVYTKEYVLGRIPDAKGLVDMFEFLDMFNLTTKVESVDFKLASYNDTTSPIEVIIDMANEYESLSEKIEPVMKYLALTQTLKLYTERLGAK